MTDRLPLILVIEEDDEVRPILSQNLRNHGYQIVVTIDEISAIERILGGQLSPDVILLNQMGRSIQDYLMMAQRIRRDSGMDSQTPIVVIAEHYEADLEGKDVQVNDTKYITYLEDGQQLMDLLQRLCLR